MFSKSGMADSSAYTGWLVRVSLDEYMAMIEQTCLVFRRAKFLCCNVYGSMAYQFYRDYQKRVGSVVSVVHPYHASKVWVHGKKGLEYKMVQFTPFRTESVLLKLAEYKHCFGIHLDMSVNRFLCVSSMSKAQRFANVRNAKLMNHCIHLMGEITGVRAERFADGIPYPVEYDDGFNVFSALEEHRGVGVENYEG